MDRRAFMYFVPGRNAVDEGDIASLGLGHLAGCLLSQRKTQNGPGGLEGLIFAARENEGSVWAKLAGYVAPDVRVGHYPAEQEWVNTGRVWIGWFKSARPRPSDLLRPMPCGGDAVSMSDGSEWLLPTLKDLPNQYGATGAGEFGARPSAKYAAAYAAIDTLRQWVAASAPMTYERVVRALCDLASVNYRAGYPEALALEIFDDEVIQTAAVTVLRLAEIAEELAATESEKKTDGAAQAPA